MNDAPIVWGFTSAVGAFVLGRVLWETITRHIDRRRLLCALTVDAVGTLSIFDELTHSLRMATTCFDSVSTTDRRALWLVLRRAPSGFIAHNLDWSATLLAERLHSPDARLALRYLDRWHRFVEFEQRYSADFEALVRGCSDSPEDMIAEYLCRLDQNAKAIVNLANELQLAAVEISKACIVKYEHALFIEPDFIARISGDRWQRLGDVDGEIKALRQKSSSS